MNPKSDDVRRVANTFRGLLEKYGDCVVDGRDVEALIENGKPCGCHAGMYALAKMGDPAPGEFDYSDGMENMKHDLGFRSTEEGVLFWAKTNPEVWGNTMGDFMFSGRCQYSFGLEGRDTLYLSHVVKWWDGVADRVKEKEHGWKPGADRGPEGGEAAAGAAGDP